MLCSIAALDNTRLSLICICKGWLSFEKHRGSSTPCCYNKNLDSLKKWNDHFFWVKSSVVPIYVLWFKGNSVKKDPLSFDDIIDFGLMEVLNEKRSGFRKYPEFFLCVVGLSQAYDDEDVRPTFLDSDNKGLLGFIKSFDHFMVNVRERTLQMGSSLPLVKKTKTAPSNTPPPQRRKNNPSVGWKTCTALQRLVTLGTLQENIRSRSAVADVDAFVSESATPSPNHEYRDESNFIQDGDAKTRPAFQIFFVLSLDSPIEPLNTRPSSSPKSISNPPHLVWRSLRVILRGHVSELETAATIRFEELVRLEAKIAKLIGQVSGLETLCDELKSQIKGEEEMRKEFSPVEAKYLAAMKDLEDIPLPLLENLEALKDSLVELLLASFTLEGIMERRISDVCSRGEKNKKGASLNLVVIEPFAVVSGSQPGSLALSVQAFTINAPMMATTLISAPDPLQVGLEAAGDRYTLTVFVSQEAPIFVTDYQISDVNVVGMRFKRMMIWSFPFQAKLSGIFYMACLVVLVYEAIESKRYDANLSIIVFFSIFSLLFDSRIATHALFSSSMPDLVAETHRFTLGPLIHTIGKAFRSLLIHQSEGSRNDFWYMTPPITAYCLDLIITILAFFASAGRVPSVRYSNSRVIQKMDDPNIAMAEYIQLKEEKARRRGEVRYFEDIDYFRDFENQFPTIVYNDALAFEPEVSSEPTIADTAYPNPMDTAY
uniref:Putative transposase (Putative), gypsy type n=1 Tax=Tanacetum cinerariifolium TaxID=118510 RepID=A0A6L2MLQ1_TANCI|nr:putative transposase (putative), gypsy type [Tanacetum cinerariifolium]